MPRGVRVGSRFVYTTWRDFHAATFRDEVGFSGMAPAVTMPSEEGPVAAAVAATERDRLRDRSDTTDAVAGWLNRWYSQVVWRTDHDGQDGHSGVAWQEEGRSSKSVSAS